MTGFNLPENFKENPEAFFRSVRPRVVAPQKTLPTKKPAVPLPPTFKTMANKTLREFAAPSADIVAIGPQINMGDVDFDLKSSLITMAQASPFCGKPNEDANAHLQQFLGICSTYTIKGVSPDAVRQRLFPFSLLGRAKQWFYANRAAVNTWDKCSRTFLSKFFPMDKANALCGRISSFQQTRDESIPEEWEQLQELTPMSRNHLDAAAGGAFFSKTVQGAVHLIEKMVSNMGWSEERLQTRQRGMHTIKETELLAAKLDLLMKRLADQEKRPQGTVKALDSHVTCEVCSNTGHSGNDCPETREEAMYMGNNNNGYRPQGETQLVQLASLVPANETRRIPGQPDSSKKDSLVEFMQNFLEKETMMPRNRYWRTPVKPTILQPTQRKPSSAPKPRKGSDSSSSRHDKFSSRSSVDVSMEDAEAPRRLLNDTDLDLVSDRERQAYYILSDREYAHTREYSPELLKKIGMDVEFRAIWKAVGWQRFAVVDEPGSRLLTLQFLCTLKEIEDGISFRFFRGEFTLTWKGLSTLLGFHNSCKIDLQKGISGFEKNRFWKDFSGAPICKKPRTNDIHNPTLTLMHKWIAMTLFPTGDLRLIRGHELIIMFAMVRKIKIAPVKCMIRQCCRELTIPQQIIEESHAGGAYRETRNMTRNERKSTSSSTPVQMYEAGWEPTGDAPGWTQAPCRSIGVLD
uniref:Transposable element protein, putative, Retrotrans_gag n=2 Tax=Oryza sativa subsp. japonica TaxID=39947 RepID=A0A5S6RCL6_ORYSJ|nr:hypothetical protein [Oryza sativa Japonica Group]AAN08662.1 hypothetical protein [Oryza sativa Japonica Group]AAP53351.1 Zinc knuckle family protein [Oryza sativa Japonica Group]